MSNISGIIASIRTIMWQDTGLNGDAQRIEQLGWMLFLKIFSDKDLELELMDSKYKSPIPPEFHWVKEKGNWAGDDEGITGDALLEFVDRKLFPALRSIDLSTGNKRALIVREVFEGNNNYMKSGINIRKVLNKLNEIDFNVAKDRHAFGELYESILKELQSAGKSGEFYTPRAITQFITDIINPQIGEKMLDPANGTGGFLTAVIEHQKKQAKNIEALRSLSENVIGWEYKPLPYLLATTNLILHDIEVPNITFRDALDKPLSAYTEKDRVDIIEANPPFGGIVANNNENNFPQSFRTKESADLFLIMMIHLLKHGGRAGIVLPDGSLSGDGMKQRIRQKLLEDCNLHTIIRLPNSVFKPYAGIAANLLFFEKGKPTKEVWYHELRLPDGVKAYSKTKPIRIEEFEPIKKWWKKRTENEFSWKVSINTIIERGYDLDIKNPSRLEGQDLPLESILARQKKSDKELTNKSQNLIHELNKLNCKEEILFVIENFESIVKANNSVALLKSFLLNLSVKGKLLNQNLNESGIELLNKIKAEREKLVEEKKLKREKDFLPIREEEIPFAIPENWVWCKLVEIGESTIGIIFKPSQVGKTGIQVLRANNIQDDKINYSNLIFVDTEVRDKQIAKLGDILICVRSGSNNLIGKAAIIEKEGMSFGAFMSLYRSTLNEYVHQFMKSDLFKNQINDKKSTGINQLTQGTLNNIMIPLPPFAEQKRIVKKLEELMNLCDELKTTITDNQNYTDQLLQVALKDALQPKEVEVAI